MNYPVHTLHPHRKRRIASAETAIRALLPLDLYEPHKRELLSVCLWKITEADGKRNLRYWSAGALEADAKDLRHEHVYERKELIARLLSGEPVASVLSDAIACLVTPEEHRALGQSKANGWSRYADAGIAVYDAQEQSWLRFKNPGAGA